MSGTCVEKLPCTCGSSDALQVFRDNQTGEITGYCFACGTYYPDPYNKGEEKEVILDWTISDIPDRNITKESCEYFGVEVQFSEENGQIYKHRYPIYRDGKKIGHKIRVCPTKQFSTQAEGKGNMLFGEQQAKGSSGKKLFVTEGELDCLSLWQVLYDYSKERYGKNMIPAVVSLRNGASSAVRELQQSASLIDRFEEIILVFDNDEAGMLAAREASKLYPDKTYIVELPEKDPSAMLVSGKGATLRQLAITARKRYKPVSLRTIDELESEVLNTQVVKGIDWPFPTLSNATFGIMRPSIYMFGAGSGVGKTEIFKEIIIKLLRDEGLPVACFFLEEPAHKTVRVLAGKLRNKRFHLPDGSWTQEELENAVAELKGMGKLILFDSAANREWEDIKNDIRYLALGEGVRDIFIDHLTALTAAAQDERREIDKIMAELGALTEELNITIYVISHLTRSENRSKPHEEGGRVKQGDFRGSGSIQFWSHFMFGIERNTQAENEEERHTTYLRCLKDRLSGNANGLVIPLRFKPETGRLEEDELAI